MVYMVTPNRFLPVKTRTAGKIQGPFKRISMEAQQAATTLQFLRGGGEMGELTRSYNWQQTSLGPPDTWPQSLRTTLGIILHSKFPMFLWWGKELTCFYNDAYRPSLGNTARHPAILGMPAKKAWADIWDTIGPMIQQVLDGGESVWHDDQLIPIYRNGRMEEVYWTFSYSPVNDDSGMIAGVLVICMETTSKVISLEKLAESRDQLAFAIEAAELGTFDYNPATGKFSANDRLKRWFGLPPEQEMDLSQALAAIENNDREMVTAAIQAALQQSTGGSYNIVYSIVHPQTAQKITVHAKGKGWFDEHGMPYRLTGTLQDITDAEQNRKQTAEAMHQLSETNNRYQRALTAGEVSKEKLNLVIEASGLGTWELSFKTDGITYSDRYLEIIGYPKGTTISHAEIVTKLHPDDLEMRRLAFESAYITGILYYQLRIVWPNETIHWIEVKGKVFHDEAGAPDYMIGTIQDITAEKDYQQELERRELQFRLLADSVPQLIWTGNANGDLNYFNQSLIHFSGMEEAMLADKGWMVLVHPDERLSSMKAWIAAVSSGRPFICEHRFRRYDGTYRWQLSRAVPQRDEQGNIKMWVGTSTDVEDQKQFADALEAQVRARTLELEQSNNSLAKINQELESFAYISSHDLQEPLRKIQTFTTLLSEREHANLSPGGRELFSRIQNAAKRMQNLIDDLLAYSRTNSAERIFEHTSLGKVAAAALADFKEELQEKQAVVLMGEMCSAVVIPFQFRQLLDNLISNAIKFSRKDIRLQISIESSLRHGAALSPMLLPDRKYCHVRFADNGIGFEPEYSEKVFGLFQRLHGRASYQGTGIGLAIVKKIVENHQGMIKASSAVNEGVVFDIYLPVNGEKVQPGL